MLSNALVLVLGPLLAVHAQSVTDSAEPPANTGIPACFTTCISNTPGCNGIIDLSCFCTQPGFQEALGACIASGCSPEEQTAASALQGSCEGITQSDTASGSSTESSATATSSEGGETSSGSESATPSATSPGSSTSGAPTTSPRTSAASSTVSSASSASSGATSPASTSNAAVSLTPFGIGTTHAIGAAGVAFGLAAGVVVVF